VNGIVIFQKSVANGLGGRLKSLKRQLVPQ